MKAWYCIGFLGLAVSAQANWTWTEKPMVAKTTKRVTERQRLHMLEQQVHQLTSQRLPRSVHALTLQVKRLQQQVAQQQQLLQLAHRATASHAMVESKSANTPVLSEKKAKASREQASYERAYEKVQAKQYEAATLALKQHIAKYPQGSHASNAWYWLGAVYHLTGQSQAAIGAFKTVAIDFSHSNKAPYAWLRIAKLYYQQQHRLKARQALSVIMSKFPQSEVMPQAQQYWQQWHMAQSVGKANHVSEANVAKPSGKGGAQSAHQVNEGSEASAAQSPSKVAGDSQNAAKVTSEAKAVANANVKPVSAASAQSS